MKKFILLFLISLLSVSIMQAQCNWKVFGTSEGLLDSSYASISFTNGKIIAGTGYSANKHGVSVWDGSNWSNFEDDSIYGAVNGAIVDQNGHYWFGGQEGLHKYDGTNLTIFHGYDSIKISSIETVFEDNDGRIWVGSFGDGISYYDGTNWVHITDTTQGLCDPYAVKFVQGLDGKLYIGSYNGCISVFDGTTPITTIHPSLNEMSSFTVDQEGVIWMTDFSFTTYSSEIVRYDGTNYTRFTNLGLAPQAYIQDIEVDEMGNLWVASNSGIAFYDGSYWRTFTKTDGLADNMIEDIAIDKQNSVWYASSYGVGKLERKTALSGNVLSQTGNITAGFVKIFKEGEGVKEFEAYDSTGITGTGTFEFTQLPVGRYILLAVPDAASYPDFIGTYYGDEDYWGNARLLILSDCDTSYSNIQIEVIKKEVLPAGNGRINGHVKSTDGTRAESNPIRDVDVTLKKVSGAIVNNTKTDDNGFYEFLQVPNGDYEIWVDIPGLSMESVRTVSITDTDTLKENEDYGVDSNGVHKDDFSSVSEYISHQIKVFPVPAHQTLHVSIKLETRAIMQAQIYNTNGKSIGQFLLQTGENILEVQDLPSGVYILAVQVGAGNYHYRFVKH